MSTARSNKRKKDKKPLYILLGFIGFFGIFVYLITRPTILSIAVKELEASINKKDVEVVWYKYKTELYNDADFLLATRNKLSSFNLSDEDIKECSSWLPPSSISVNLIIVPDLSRRIIDTLNNPGQVSNDIFLIQKIWKSFENISKLKQNTKDKLIVDVTDIDQAKGQFSNVANLLQFDLSKHKDKSNRLYFTREKETDFMKSIQEMYALAQQKPLGADYKFYLRRYLVNHLKKPTLFDNYINKVIFITDGYLEAENQPADTKIYGFENVLHQSVIIGNTLDVITLNGLNIPKVPIDLTNTEILVCEVNERRSGKSYDFEILKAYWEDWFKRMAAKKFVFIERKQAIDETVKSIDDFLTH
jgi:hypothetical protein